MASEVKTKAIIIYVEGKPIYIARVKELSAREFVELKTQCESNLKELDALSEQAKQSLLNRVAELEHEVKILKGEE